MNRRSATDILPQYTISTSIQQQQKSNCTGHNEQVFFSLKIRSLEVGSCWHQLCHLMMPSKTQILSVFLHSYLHTCITIAKWPLQLQHQVRVQGKRKWKRGRHQLSQKLPPAFFLLCISSPWVTWPLLTTEDAGKTSCVLRKKKKWVKQIDRQFLSRDV